VDTPGVLLDQADELVCITAAFDTALAPEHQHLQGVPNLSHEVDPRPFSPPVHQLTEQEIVSIEDQEFEPARAACLHSAPS
jgi:hypothetical protein